MKRLFHFLLYLYIAALLVSCSGKKVLLLNDPYFEYFASSSDSFYRIKKKLVFLKAGYGYDFVDPEETENLQQINDLLNSGEYDGLVTFYYNYHSLEIPVDLPTILIGGSQEILYSSSMQVVSSDRKAIEIAGSELQKLWVEEGKIPLTVFWENPLYAEEERNILENSWDLDNRKILIDNWLNLDIDDVNSEKMLEDFFNKYDFKASDYIVYANCAPVYKEFMRTVPKHPDLPLILALPDSPVLPDTTYAVLSEDYLGLITAAVKSLKEYSPGNIIKVENKFIKK